MVKFLRCSFLCDGQGAVRRSILSMTGLVLIEIMFILKAIKTNFKESYDKQNLTLLVISHEIYETRSRLVS